MGQQNSTATRRPSGRILNLVGASTFKAVVTFYHKKGAKLLQFKPFQACCPCFIQFFEILWVIFLPISLTIFPIIYQAIILVILLNVFLQHFLQRLFQFVCLIFGLNYEQCFNLELQDGSSFNLIFFKHKFQKLTIHLKLVGTNPNCPNIFHRACDQQGDELCVCYADATLEIKKHPVAITAQTSQLWCDSIRKLWYHNFLR